MRPLGVTLSALVQFLRGALIAMLGLAILFAGGLTSRLVGMASEGNLLPRFLSGVGHFIGLGLLFTP